MKPIKFLASACKYCRHYQPEGRRGGMCQQLGAPVQASWKACSLAIPPFAPSWETLEDAWGLPDAKPVLTSCQSLVSDLDNAALALVEETTVSTSQEAKTKTVLI
ncbi:hypothetical protein IQ276_023735 [Desmonostoc muscorum LEGE 12446]|uniref:Uncharacterized protein n=1 Tax=Desmonostoc muscorum LEGE 12446 TaxID=1828758 RepID=A0A8J7A7K0_DESMC|nr:hypothetical protein [Desmonostoc muscorum]MCF2149387.1 hypothetical protein [Desmonostoc muscorum LEGE 12446]